MKERTKISIKLIKKWVCMIPTMQTLFSYKKNGEELQLLSLQGIKQMKGRNKI